MTISNTRKKIINAINDLFPNPTNWHNCIIYMICSILALTFTIPLAVFIIISFFLEYIEETVILYTYTPVTIYTHNTCEIEKWCKENNICYAILTENAWPDDRAPEIFFKHKRDAMLYKLTF